MCSSDLASIGAALDPAKAAYAEGTIPQQAPVKATGVAPGTEKTPDASPASKSIRFAMQAYTRGDFSATMKALHKAVTEDPKLAKEFQILINQLAVEQQKRQEKGVPTS